jgi:hypothetical protein
MFLYSIVPRIEEKKTNDYMSEKSSIIPFSKTIPDLMNILID